MKFRTSIKDETSLSEKGDDLPAKKNTAEKCNTLQFHTSKKLMQSAKGNTNGNK